MGYSLFIAGEQAEADALLSEGIILSDDLPDSEDDEDDLLDMAWGLTPQSRLSCQVRLDENTDLTIEIPRYTINHAREEH